MYLTPRRSRPLSYAIPVLLLRLTKAFLDLILIYTLNYYDIAIVACCD